MIVAKFGRGVCLGIHRQHIAVGIGVVGTSHERKQTGTLVIEFVLPGAARRLQISKPNKSELKLMTSIIETGKLLFLHFRQRQRINGN